METRRLVLTLTGIGVVLIVVLGGLSIALLATGGGNDSSSAQNGSQTSPAATAQLPQRVAGELRLFGADPISLDPACASDADSAAYIVELFSGLVSFGCLLDQWSKNCISFEEDPRRSRFCLLGPLINPGAD